MTAVVMVCLGAALGAPARYLADRGVQSLHDSVFPFGTLSVNIVGSFVLGVLVSLGLPSDRPAYLALGTGFCGAFTTYSTFSYETVRLVETGSWGKGLLNVAASIGGGLAAAVLGFLVGSSL